MHVLLACLPDRVGDSGNAGGRGPRSGGGDGLSKLADRVGAVFLVGVAASVKIALANVLLGLTALAWAWALRTRAVRWRRAAIHVPALGYVIASILAVAFSRDPRISVGELASLGTLLLLPMTVSLMDPRLFDRLLAALTGVASLSSLVGLWQYLHGASHLAHRLRGLNTHYMTFGGWTLVVVLLLVADIAFNRDRRRLWWTLPGLLVCTLALLLSYTRSAWVGLAAGLVLVAAVWKPKALWTYPVLAVILLVALPQPVVARMFSIFDLRQPSNYDRLCMIRSGIQMTQDHPVFGVGLGMVDPRYPVYRADDAPQWRVPHLHNNVVQIAAERGLMGLAAYLGMLAVFGVHTWRALRHPRQPAFAPLAGCFLAVAGLTVAGLFEYNWGDTEVWMLTLVCLASPFALAPEAS